MKLFIILWILISTSYAVESDLCDVIDIPKCRGITKQLRRNTFQSAPTSGTATVLNPSNVRFDKGLGVEAIAQANSPVTYGLTSGTGKMGGALIAGSLDNTFFGNRVPELDQDFIERHADDKAFENKKNTFALGAKLFSNRNFGLDIGVIAKRHQEVKDINIGGGFSARAGMFHFGASSFKDDYFLKSPVPGGEDFSDSFTVTTYTGGVRIKNVALDIASINSSIDFYKSMDAPDTRILIYSASYYYKDFLFNGALRKETSGAGEFAEPDQIKMKEEKSGTFFSVQYSFGKHVIFGVMYNYFLMQEASATLSLFI